MENYFEGCLSLREVKHRYLALAREHHPALGNDPTTLFQVRLEYQQVPRDPSYGFYQHPEDVKDDFLHYPEVVDRLLGWRLNVELIGTWTWVSGESFPFRDRLIEMGFSYEPLKQAWYSRPVSYRSANPSPLPFDKIKSLHGRPVGIVVPAM
jgi:hypothetical protein